MGAAGLVAAGCTGEITTTLSEMGDICDMHVPALKFNMAAAGSAPHLGGLGLGGFGLGLGGFGLGGGGLSTNGLMGGRGGRGDGGLHNRNGQASRYFGTRASRCGASAQPGSNVCNGALQSATSNASKRAAAAPGWRRGGWEGAAQQGKRRGTVGDTRSMLSRRVASVAAT